MIFTLFILTVSILAYILVGYPLCLLMFAKLFPHPIQKDSSFRISISIILVVRNEASRIEARLRNLAASLYPPDRLEIILVSDGSSDDTLARARSLGLPNTKLIECPVPAGKATGVTAGIAAATGDILVFTDARQDFTPSTLRELAANFADPTVGAVSGALDMATAPEAPGAGVGAYWTYEKLLRHAESRLDSTVGCTGAVYAMRRPLARPLPPDTILDDVILPMQAVLEGYRVVFDPDAKAYDPLPPSPGVEKRRKERTLAGNLQMLIRHPSWLLPWRNRLWWQLLSHKYLRLLLPGLLLAMLILNACLLTHPALIAFLVLQLAGYSLAAVGWLFPDSRTPLLTIPAGFIFLNLTILGGFWRFFRGGYAHGWKELP